MIRSRYLARPAGGPLAALPHSTARFPVPEPVSAVTGPARHGPEPAGSPAGCSPTASRGWLRLGTAPAPARPFSSANTPSNESPYADEPSIRARHDVAACTSGWRCSLKNSAGPARACRIRQRPAAAASRRPCNTSAAGGPAPCWPASPQDRQGRAPHCRSADRHGGSAVPGFGPGFTGACRTVAAAAAPGGVSPGRDGHMHRGHRPAPAAGRPADHGRAVLASRRAGSGAASGRDGPPITGLMGHLIEGLDQPAKGIPLGQLRRGLGTARTRPPKPADRLEHLLVVGDLDDIAVRVMQRTDVAYRF